MNNTDIEKAQRTIYLLSLAAEGGLNASEEEELRKWVEQSDANKGVYDELTDPSNLAKELRSWDPEQTEASLQKIVAKVGKPQSRMLWRRIAGVAAAVAAVTLSVWIYSAHKVDKNRNETPLVSVPVNDIGPGKNTATLTLANGKTIQLSDSKSGVVIGNDLKYDDSTSVGSAIDVLDNRITTLTASTPRGGTYEFTLPDGTRIWLNADSKISFPSQFVGVQRKVSLTGEAYFEVKQDKTWPFVVDASGQQVEVLGTHFNIKNYPNESEVRTTLVEGKVRLRNSVASRILMPGQQGISENDRITVKDIDTDIAIAWKNKEFAFEREPIETVMKMVERWYNVEIVFVGEKTTELLSGSVSRFDNVSKVLKLIESTGASHFQIKDRKIYVSK
ncbi:FecR family protein [Pedobacter frigoris]|uniref:FecR family protein n=1 Tax=Pedobacter frigoris TaxID=2571272 RepID=UPI0029319583|nr:FecR domain-containing protein [Pedobacter frigoris]